MNARSFLVLALKLLQTEKSPEGYRTAVSRAYYAAYNVAVELLEGMGFPVGKGPQTHGKVQHYLSNSGDDELIQVGHDLRELQSQRIRADYRLDKRDVENEDVALNLVDQASSMIAVLDACRLSEPRRAQVAAAIEQWIKATEGRDS
jgi:uncharacterized protein (UPF0332 family)